MNNNDTIIDKKKIYQCLTILKEYFSNRQIENIANVEVPNSIRVDTEEWILYIFYSCLLDYGMRSKIYHKNLIDTFNKYPEIFNPKYVVGKFSNYEDALLDIIKNNIHPRYPNVALEKWIKLSKELLEYDSLLKKVKSFHSYSEVEAFIKSINGYGQKTGGLLLRLISESSICDFDDDISSIPLDRHDIEISYLSGIIKVKKLNSSQIGDLSNAFIKVGKEIGISPNAVDKYLWEIGNTFCNRKDCGECPLRLKCSKMVKEKCE